MSKRTTTKCCSELLSINCSLLLRVIERRWSTRRHSSVTHQAPSEHQKEMAVWPEKDFCVEAILKLLLFVVSCEKSPSFPYERTPGYVDIWTTSRTERRSLGGFSGTL